MEKKIAGMSINLPELQVDPDSKALDENFLKSSLQDMRYDGGAIGNVAELNADAFFKQVYEFDVDPKDLETSERSWLPQLKGKEITTNQTNYERHLLEDLRNHGRSLLGAMESGCEALTKELKYIALGGLGINIIDKNEKYRVAKGRMNCEYYLSKTQRKLIIHSLIKYARRNRNKEFLSILKLIRSNIVGKKSEFYFDISKLTTEDAKILVNFIKQTRKVPHNTINNSLIPDNRLYVIKDIGERYAPYMPLNYQPTYVKFNGVSSIKAVAKVNIC